MKKRNTVGSRGVSPRALQKGELGPPFSFMDIFHEATVYSCNNER